MHREKSRKGIFITLEGIEASGKTTQLKFIQTYLLRKKKIVQITREPGGTPLAEAIRELLLQPNVLEENLIPETELLLLNAARLQHIEYVIRPALNQGKWIVSDRFSEATFAYQGGGRGIPLEKIMALQQWIHSDIKPDCILLFDISIEEALARLAHRHHRDRIESEKKDFFERVRSTYLERAKVIPAYRVIDSNLSLKAVEEQVATVLETLL